jgi:S-DNA-T family DNA segregation ATPase FtsK/SpoIIIE
VVVIDELADLMMVASNEGRGIDLPPGADGPCGWHPPDPGHAAAVGGRHHRPHQGQPAVADLVPCVVEDRLAHDSRQQRRRTTAGQGRHAVPAAGIVAPHPSARPLHLGTGERTAASFLRKQGKPVFDDTITAEDETTSVAGVELEKDDLYDQAARIVVETRQASISFLQRKMRIGFSRAARLVDMMEAEGLVSPSSGGKPREVLVPPNYFDEIDEHPR